MDFAKEILKFDHIFSVTKIEFEATFTNISLH